MAAPPEDEGNNRARADRWVAEMRRTPHKERFFAPPLARLSARRSTQGAEKTLSAPCWPGAAICAGRPMLVWCVRGFADRNRDQGASVCRVGGPHRHGALSGVESVHQLAGG